MDTALTIVRVIMVLVAAWIGTLWPTSWTSLLGTAATATLFLAMAYDNHKASSVATARDRIAARMETGST